MPSWILTNATTRARRYGPFLVWATWFVVAWLTLVILGDHWRLVVQHWGTAIAMAVGSYVAGSTPMGGGTVGFPVLVLLFGEPASLGRQFSFAIQAVGMTSATLFIVCSGRPIAIRLLLWAMLASGVTLPLASAFLLPHLAESTVKLAFACIWGSFGFLTLVKIREMRHWHHLPRMSSRTDAFAGLAIGVLGGVASALTGVGIDMIAYTVLVLLYRCDLRVAISTSVVLMAYNSLIGVLVTAASGEIGPDLLGHWLAAAPVVLFGAPLGALMLQVIPRTPTMILVALLCLVQLVWMSIHVGVGWTGAGLIALTMLVANGAFHLLYRAGVGIQRA
ncbi:MAG: sulfite exporter TauE/SafE family protein [Phycisphaeraceae bacterium]|nr:MAG: sulfite exporter TauE/SafE family protein [Phycisphaeraceae bacterium]